MSQALGIIPMFIMVLVAMVIFLYWKFMCWVAKRTNVNSCFVMFIISLFADGFFLKGNTTAVMCVLALIRLDIGSRIGSPRVSAKEFKAITQPMKRG